MKKLTIILMVAAGLVGCGGGGGSGSGNQSKPDPAGPMPAAGTVADGRLHELVEWTRKSHELPALATLIMLDGQVAEASVEGVRTLSDLTGATLQDQWHIGSLTKAMTSTLAGALVEMSVVSWRTTPLDVWPELDASIHPGFRDITLRQLLSHTAGVRITNSAPSQYLDAAPGAVSQKRRAFAAELLQEAPASQIGSESYSNGGYIIAGAMMETMMSASWESLLTDYVFAPLNMTNSGFGAPGLPGDTSQPWGHTQSGGSFNPVSPGPNADNPQVFGPAGTVHTSLGDYANFMLAHITGARGIDGILTAATFDILHEPVHNGSALGWGARTSTASGGMLELTHAGSNTRWFAIVALVPEIDAGAVFITNAGGDRAANAVAVLQSLIVERVQNSR